MILSFPITNMAVVKIFFTNSQLFKQNINFLRPLLQQNGMAMYPPYFIEPIYRKEHQQDLVKSGDISQYTHLPTKAALNDQTSSLSHDPLIVLFTHYLMRNGDKVLARELVEKSLEQVKRIQLERYHKSTSKEDKSKIELNPKVVFHKAVENCKPILQLMAVKRGGVRYMVPVPVSNHRAQFLSMKWLIEAAREKDKKMVRFWTQLGRELVEAANNNGRVVRRKQELHKQCEANKAYAHYRWS